MRSASSGGSSGVTEAYNVMSSPQPITSNSGNNSSCNVNQMRQREAMQPPPAWPGIVNPYGDFQHHETWDLFYLYCYELQMAGIVNNQFCGPPPDNNLQEQNPPENNQPRKSSEELKEELSSNFSNKSDLKSDVDHRNSHNSCECSKDSIKVSAKKQISVEVSNMTVDDTEEGNSITSEEWSESSESSDIETLMDFLETKFKDVIDEKIQATENLYDNTQYVMSTFGKDLTSKSNREFGTKGQLDRKKLFPLSGSDVRNGENSLGKLRLENQKSKPALSIAVQTDLKSESDSEKKCVLSEVKSSEAEIRNSIQKLRERKESLVNLRKKASINLREGNLSGETEFLSYLGKDVRESWTLEKQIIHFEESIEALDLFMESFNEKLSKPDTSQEHIHGALQGLDFLNIKDWQKLIGAYLKKVTELRHCSNKLETEVQTLENVEKEIRGKLSREHRRIKEKEEEYAQRIKLMIKDKDPSSRNYITRLEKDLLAAKHKIDDLESSLTQLLIHHGYLLHGTDWDVKQVMRRLGLPDDCSGKKPIVPSRDVRIENAKDRQSRRYRRHAHHNMMIPELSSSLAAAANLNCNNQGAENNFSRHISSNFQQPHSSRVHYRSNHTGHGRQHLESNKEGPKDVAEVRRAKHKIIIHPPNH